MKQIHIFISGDVQGVGYRQFVKHVANKNHVVGWVKNLPDGRVEAVMQAEELDLDHTLDQIKKGPFLAEVKDVQVIFNYVNQVLSNFEVR